VLLDLPEPNEYVVEARAHLAAFHGRRDVVVGHLRSGEDPSGALVATPILNNRPVPTVRLAVDEGASRVWPGGSGRASPPTTLLYRQVVRVPLLYVAIQAVTCPLLAAADARDGLCGDGQSLIDRRVFAYGWEVYAVDPGRARPTARLTVSGTRIREGE
jgi:hypothetical protein